MAVEIKIGATFNDKEVKRAQRELQNLSNVSSRAAESMTQKFSRIGQSMQSFGKDMTTKVTLPLAAVGAAGVMLAADLEDSMGATEQIFGSAAGSVQQWAEDLPSYFGIAEGAALSHVNIMGSMLQNIGGLAESEASRQGQALLELAGDLTAMYGGTVEQAVQALTGALKGNNAMLDNYGMGINEATIKAKALEMGIHEGTGALSLQAKQAATLALIWEQTGAAQGQAAREAGTASGRMRALKTDVMNLVTQIGEELLPVVSKAAEVFSSITGFLSRMPGPIRTLVVGLGTIVAAAGPVIWATGSMLRGFSEIMAIDWRRGFSTGVMAMRGFVSAVQGGASAALTALRGMSSGAMLALGGVGLALAAAGVALKVLADQQAAAAEKRFKSLSVSTQTLANAIRMLSVTGQSTTLIGDLSVALRDLQTEAEGSYNWFLRWNKGPGKQGLGLIGDRITDVDDNAAKARETLGRFDDVLSQLAVTSAPQAVAQFNALQQAASLDGLDLTLEMLPQLETEITAAAEAAGMSVDDFLAMAGAGGEVKTEFELATEALEDWEKEVRSQFDPLFAYGDSLDSLSEAQRRQEEAAWNALGAVAEHGAGSSIAQQAIEDYQASIRDTTSATFDTAFQLERLKEGLRTGGVDFITAAQHLDGLVAAGLMTEDQARLTKDEWARLADQVVTTPSYKELTINTNVTEVTSQFQTLVDTINGLPDSQFKSSMQIIVGGLNPGQADGGPVMGGRAGWVGERGRELFIPKVDGTIVPHYQSRRIVEELGGEPRERTVVTTKPGTVNVYVNKTDASPYDIGRELLWQMKVAS